MISAEKLKAELKPQNLYKTPLSLSCFLFSPPLPLSLSLTLPLPPLSQAHTHNLVSYVLGYVSLLQDIFSPTKKQLMFNNL